MTDIKERLRGFGPDWTTRHAGHMIPYQVCAEAADEIEWLQEDKRLQAEDIMTLGQQVGKLETEIERLLDEVERLQSNAERAGW
jgi:hypothetical protein